MEPAEGSAGGSREPGGCGGNWMATHPTFTEMMSLDISDSAQIYAAFVVYLDLLEGRNWHEVKHVGVAELQLICLHARQREQDSLEVMVPVPVHISLSHESKDLENKMQLMSVLDHSLNHTELAEVVIGINAEKAVCIGLAVPIFLASLGLRMSKLEAMKKAEAVDELVLRIREILKKASLPRDDPNTPLSVTLAIVETDSTVVYYKMTDGLVMPDPPDDPEDVDNKQWRKKRKKLFK